MPAIVRLINKSLAHPELFWAYVDECLDYGGGRYEKLTEYLARIKVRNLVYDPYNRPQAHNDLIRQMLTTRPADVGICSNVLNVIREPAVRHEILQDVARLVKPAGRIFITVYEGDKSSRGRKTTKGWQSNRPAKNYVREIRRVFPGAFGVKIGGKKLIICDNPVEV
jgi:hypothetical protein